MSSNRSIGYYRYRQLRAVVLADAPMCAYCRTRLATTADHWIPVAAGGLDELENLVPACSSCNLAKRDLMPDVFIATLHRGVDCVDHADW